MRIELRHATKTYPSVKALDDVTLAFEPGQVVALLGANGAGKTTLLRAMAGIVGIDRGEIHFDGEAFRRDRLDLRRRFHFLPDFPAVFETWTPLQHVGMVLRLYEVEVASAPARVTELFRELDLLALAEAPFHTLSRGQRYKTGLAALLAVDPELWLLDEPFASGMDPHAINAFKRRAREAATRGRTVVYSTQILDAAERFSDRVCVIHGGRIRAFEETSRLRAGSPDANALDEIFSKLREEDQL